MIGNIEVFIQNSIRIRSRVGVIYIDPFQMKEEPKDADFVLVTKTSHTKSGHTLKTQ